MAIRNEEPAADSVENCPNKSPLGRQYHAFHRKKLAARKRLDAHACFDASRLQFHGPSSCPNTVQQQEPVNDGTSEATGNAGMMTRRAKPRSCHLIGQDVTCPFTWWLFPFADRPFLPRFFLHALCLFQRSLPTPFGAGTGCTEGHRDRRWRYRDGCTSVRPRGGGVTEKWGRLFR